VHFVAKAEKPEKLIDLLDTHRDELALVFGRTKHGSDKLARKLEAAGFAVAAIHGNKSQGQRDRALRAFRAGEVRVLVATDVAARGLDIPDVKHVYNYELPNVAENYVHRIGRTARAGRDGAAIAFCAPEEMGELKDIQKAMGLSIPVASGAPWEQLPDPAAAPKSGRGGPGGKGQPGRRRRRRGPPRGQRKAA
jgi:ATP-dependent RNA helicase RhlE